MERRRGCTIRFLVVSSAPSFFSFLLFFFFATETSTVRTFSRNVLLINNPSFFFAKGTATRGVLALSAELRDFLPRVSSDALAFSRMNYFFNRVQSFVIIITLSFSLSFGQIAP